MVEIIVRRVRCSKCEDFMILENYETLDVLLSGDVYHDKIHSKIDGFIAGLEYAGFEVREAEDIMSDEDNHYEFICGC